jgi:hypothetical protein
MRILRPSEMLERHVLGRLNPIPEPGGSRIHEPDRDRPGFGYG